MKKITILLITICTTFGAYAQYSKGRMLVGGSLGFSAVTDKTKANGTTTTLGKSTDFSFAPQFGYFVIDNLAVGAGLDIGVGKWNDEFDGDDDWNYSSVEFIPFVRYYLPQNIFFQGMIGVGSQKNEYGSGETYKDAIFSWSLAAGYAYFLTDNVAVEPLIGYGSTSWSDKDSDVKDIDMGLFLRVGFQIYLDKL
jgi:outer membrane protein